MILSYELTTEEFRGWLNLYWESYGPWVDKESLTDDGKQLQEVFKKLLGDTRLKFGAAVHYGRDNI